MTGAERADYFLRGCAGMSDRRERKSHAEGVFDRTQSVRSGAWGNPNKLHRNIENDIPMPCLPTLSEFSVSQLRFCSAECVLCLALGGI